MFRAVVWMAVVVMAQGAWATTFRPVRVACPLDGTTFVDTVAGSMFVPGVTRDLRPRAPGVKRFVASLLTCPTCRYTAAVSGYTDTAVLDVAKVKAALAGVQAPPLFRELARAVAVEEAGQADPARLARLALALKWTADATGEPAVMNAYRSVALDRHLALLETLAADAPERPAVVYLIGELLRESGQRAAALQWLNEAAAGTVEESVRAMAEHQRFVARWQGAPCRAVVAAARGASAWERVAAVELLRACDAAEAVALVGEVCLRGPEATREPHRGSPCATGDAGTPWEMPHALLARGTCGH